MAADRSSMACHSVVGSRGAAPCRKGSGALLRAKGWQHEQSIVLGAGKGNTRIHDTARTNAAGGRDFTEYKSGVRVPGDAHTLNQIALDREVLSRDPHATGTWVMRVGAADPMVRQQLDVLQRGLPGRFQVVEVSRAEAEKARKLGRALEQQAQKAAEQARQHERDCCRIQAGSAKWRVSKSATAASRTSSPR